MFMVTRVVCLDKLAVHRESGVETHLILDTELVSLLGLLLGVAHELAFTS